MSWNSVRVNVDVDIDIDDIISDLSKSDKVDLILSLSTQEIKSILIEKGLLPKGLPFSSICDLEGDNLKRFICDITLDSYRVDIDKLLSNLKSKL